MSILSKIFVSIALMASAAYADTNCRYHNGEAIYQLESGNNSYTMEAVKAVVDIEKVMDFLQLGDLIDQMTDDDRDALIAVVEDSEIFDRNFRSGDKLTIAKDGSKTKISLETVPVNGFSTYTGSVLVSGGVYTKLSEVIQTSEMPHMTAGACN